MGEQDGQLSDAWNAGYRQGYRDRMGGYAPIAGRIAWAAGEWGWEDEDERLCQRAASLPAEPDEHLHAEEERG